jgi:FtsH-binding integral membrane protein
MTTAKMLIAGIVGALLGLFWLAVLHATIPGWRIEQPMWLVIAFLLIVGGFFAGARLGAGKWTR